MVGPTVRVKGCTEAQIPSMAPRRDGRDAQGESKSWQGKAEKRHKIPFIPDAAPLQ